MRIIVYACLLLLFTLAFNKSCVVARALPHHTAQKLHVHCFSLTDRKTTPRTPQKLEITGQFSYGSLEAASLRRSLPLFLE